MTLKTNKSMKTIVSSHKSLDKEEQDERNYFNKLPKANFTKMLNDSFYNKRIEYYKLEDESSEHSYENINKSNTIKVDNMNCDTKSIINRNNTKKDNKNEYINKSDKLLYKRNEMKKQEEEK